MYDDGRPKYGGFLEKKYILNNVIIINAVNSFDLIKRIAEKIGEIMEILIIDPSGTDNYLNGLTDAVSKIAEVDVSCRDNYSPLDTDKSNVYKNFLISSNPRERNKLIKGFRYLIGHFKTLKMAFKNKYKVIHIQWMMYYPIDILLIPLYKKCCDKLIYTAHNIIPHVNGEKQKSRLNKIYQKVDSIVVHGDYLRDKLLTEFPEINPEKVFVQHHGENLNIHQSIQTMPDQVKVDSIERCTGKVILYLGVIFKNKGVDRLMKYWNSTACNRKKDILVIAGKITEADSEFENLSSQFSKLPNAVYIPERLSKSQHDYLYEKCDIVVLPYREASMSGVIFDAASFSRPVLTTNTGAIPEYLNNNEDSFIVENSDDSFNEGLDRVLDMDNAKLKLVGSNLNKNIKRDFNWDLIARKLVHDIYEI